MNSLSRFLLASPTLRSVNNQAQVKDIFCEETFTDELQCVLFYLNTDKTNAKTIADETTTLFKIYCIWKHFILQVCASKIISYIFWKE